MTADVQRELAEELRDVLRIHHPTMRSETGPFSGCRCGAVKLGQDVIQHVVDEVRAIVEHAARDLMLRPLTCTYCGGKLTIDTETTGRPYLSYEVPGSITCDEMGCQAVWEPDGTPRDLPAFVRFPSLYTQPDPT